MSEKIAVGLTISETAEKTKIIAAIQEHIVGVEMALRLPDLDPENREDFNIVEEEIEKLINIYDIQDTDKLPQHELASKVDSFSDDLFQLREQIKQAKGDSQ